MKIIISPFSQRLRNGKQNPKNYPYWAEVIERLASEGHEICQVGATGEEVFTTHKFDLRMLQLREFIKNYDHFISVDNFFHHFAHWYSFTGVVLFSQSDPEIFGYRDNINLLKDRKYLRKDQFQIWEASEYNPVAYVEPNEVIKAINSFE